MSQSKVNSENYIQIQGWMLKELGLKGNELLIFAIIYGFSQDGVTRYKGGLQYLADWTNSTKQGVLKNIKNLLDKEYIEKEEIQIADNLKFCNYYVNIEKVYGSKQSLMGGKQSLMPSKQSLTNNILNNKEIINEMKYIPEKEKNISMQDTINNIISYLNKVAGTKYKPTTQTTINFIKARLKDGFTFEDFKLVIDKKYKEWVNTDMEKYLRPETLFGNKFENYLNQKSNVQSSKFDNTASHKVDSEKLTDVEFNNLYFEDKKKYLSSIAVADMSELQRKFFDDYCIATDDNGNQLEF